MLRVAKDFDAPSLAILPLSRLLTSVQGKFIASILARGQIYAPIYMPAIMQGDYCNMGEIGKEFSIKIESMYFPFPILYQHS